MRSIVFFFLVASVCCRAQQMQFDNLTSKEGLPQNTVFSLLEDKHGFVWIGTAGGLCRYDGRSFKHFQLIRKTRLRVFSIIPYNA